MNVTKAAVTTKLTLNFPFFLLTSLFFLFFFFSSIRSAYANKITDLSSPKAKIFTTEKNFKSIKSVDSNKYYSNLQEAMKNVESYLEALKENLSPQLRPIFLIVLDIDETAISTIEYIKSQGLDRNEKAITEAIEKSTYPIKPILTFYEKAINEGFSVFFITNREASLRHQTTLNLKKAGYIKWDGLIMRPKDFKGNVTEFKQEARKWIRNQGYQIVLNIDDQESGFKKSDSEGDVYGSRDIKLPNPFYTIH